MSLLPHSPAPHVDMIKPTSRFTEHISPLPIPEITITPAQSAPIHNLDSVSDSESDDSYSETSDMGDGVPVFEGIIDLISRTTESGLAIIVESYPFYSMLVQCSQTHDTASEADTAMRMVVQKCFSYARRNMVSRRQCVVGGRSLWWASGKQALPPKRAPRVTYEQNQDLSDQQPKEAPHMDISDQQSREAAHMAYEQNRDISKKQSKQAPHIIYEQKQNISDRQSNKAPRITYEQKQKILDHPLKEAPHTTYEQKQVISKLVNCLPERDMEVAFNIVRKGMPNFPDIMDHDFEVDIDKLPNHILYSLLRFVREYEFRSGDISRVRRASAADSAALVLPVATPTRCRTA